MNPAARRAAIPQSAAALLDEHYDYVLRLAWSILDDAHEAEDAAQETFLAALKALDRYRGKAAFRTWLYRIAVNVCRAHLRKRRLRALASRLWGQDAARRATTETAEGAVLRSEADRQLWTAVAALDDRHRLPLILRYLNDLTAPEIAQVLGISEGTVYSRLHHARRKLRRRLALLDDDSNSHAEELP